MKGDKNLPADLKDQHTLVGRPLFVKLIRELSVAALKTKQDKELALWYELRALNVTGSGRLFRDDAVAALVRHFGYSIKTVYRLLRAGNGKLWDIYLTPVIPGRSQIKIYGVYKVGEWLNTSSLSRPIEVRAGDFKGRRTKRAWLYGSFFKPDGSTAKPISRANIKVATGVLRRQQVIYDKLVGIKRTANFAFQQDGHGLAPMFDLVEGKRSQYRIVRRLGNTYHSRALKAQRGMTRKINAELRQRSLTRDEARLSKRFFLTVRSLMKSPEKHVEAFLLMNKRDRLIKGRMEWCLVV